MSLKIIWLCNTVIPEAAEKMHIRGNKPESWISGTYERIKDNDEYELTYLFPYEGQHETSIGSNRFVNYNQKSQLHVEDDQIKEFRNILRKTNPDIIHIMGTEYPHTYAMVKACCDEGFQNKVIISIQGMVHYCKMHFLEGITPKEATMYTFRDFIKRDNLIRQVREFGLRGNYEQKAIENVSHVIGRTEWDYVCTHLINPDVNYHFCSETLRPVFYKKRWSINSCERHSIFVSQSDSPVKGFHFMLRAMPYVLKFYPDAHVYVTGKDPLNLSVKDKIRQRSYNRILGDIIKKYHLSQYVTFLGSLDEQQMCDRYLKSHVFVSCSTIENSSNSIGEARILGMPVVASFVGGTRFVTDNEDGLVYQADAPYMLAAKICNIFKDDVIAIRLGTLARERALVEHDPDKNLKILLSIYDEVRMSS